MLFGGQRQSPYPSAVLEVSSPERQQKIRQILTEVEAGVVPSTFDELKKLFQSLLFEAGNARTDKSLRIDGVVHHILEQEHFFNKTLPFLASIAKRLTLLFPEGLAHLTRTHPQKHLRRIQVLGLLAAAFFGIIPHDQRKLLQSYGSLELNKLDLFHRGFFEREPKYRALLIYFTSMQSTLEGCWQQMVQRNSFERAQCSPACICQEVVFRGQASHFSPADELISFYLHTPEQSVFEIQGTVRFERGPISVTEILKSSKPLLEPKVDVDGDIMLSDGELQVDFADRFVGGLSVFAGHVAQEELFFAVRPELLVVMLFVQTLDDDEALVVKGAESFVLYSGYEHTFNVSYPENIPPGSHWSIHGLTPLDPLGRRETTVVVIDALEVKWDFDMQYSEQNIRRELFKATLGFHGDPFENLISTKRAPVSTGKWGCFIFGGDNELKSLIQWIAATYTGRTFHFNAFRDGKLTHMQHTLMQIGKKFPTIRQLVEAIQGCVQQKPKNQQRKWSLWKCLLQL
ncbi:hypothetical protein Esti_005519 [Eimeria stiedai]